GRAKERIRQSAPTIASGTLVVKSAGQLTFIKTPEIDWIEAADYYACLHVGRRSYLLRRTLADLEQQLDQNFFCRVHRSALVNLHRVQSLKVNPAGEYDVVLADQTRIALSRRYRKELEIRLGVRTPMPT